MCLTAPLRPGAQVLRLRSAAMSPGTPRLLSLGSNQPSASYITAPPRPRSTHEQTLCRVSPATQPDTREDSPARPHTHPHLHEALLVSYCHLPHLHHYPFLEPLITTFSISYPFFGPSLYTIHTTCLPRQHHHPFFFPHPFLIHFPFPRSSTSYPSIHPSYLFLAFFPSASFSFSSKTTTLQSLVRPFSLHHQPLTPALYTIHHPHSPTHGTIT